MPPRRIKNAHRKPDPAVPTMRTMASVAPATVAALAKGETDRRTRRRAQKKKPGTSPVDHVVVDPAVWEAAQALLGDDHGYTRVVILSEHEVLVR